MRRFTGSSRHARNIRDMATTQLTAAGVGAGDEVVLPAFGGAEVAAAVRESGARPVFADIDAGTFCLDPASAETALTRRTVAVVALPLFGHPAATDALREMSVRRGVRVLEWGPVPRTDSVDAVRRRQHAALLDRRLTGVVIPSAARRAEHAYSEYVVRVPGNGRPDRDAFKRALRARGVDCAVPVRTPAHWLPEFRTDVHLPEAQRAVDECLALPLAASMTKRDVQHMISACNALGGLLYEAAS